jgi:RNA polymerase sigma-70 factor, ECF subfamily
MSPSNALAAAAPPPIGEFDKPGESSLADQPPPRLIDEESRSWLRRLHATEPTRGRAIAELHERLRREAAFHLRRRVRDSSDFPRSDIDDLAIMAANDALLAIMRKLDDYRGDSQFWTWARRFAELEAPVSIRRRLGHDHLAPGDPEHQPAIADPGRSPQERVETRELLQAVSDLVVNQLTARQRTVLIAIVINGASAETLACELHTTSGAIYKALHDARVKLRPELV